MLLSLLPVTIVDAELELYKIMLIKLLICKIENLSDDTKDLYYENLIPGGDFFSKGIPQGLPQSYFFGNICMIEVGYMPLCMAGSRKIQREGA